MGVGEDIGMSLKSRSKDILESGAEVVDSIHSTVISYVM